MKRLKSFRLFEAVIEPYDFDPAFAELKALSRIEKEDLERVLAPMDVELVDQCRQRGMSDDDIIEHLRGGKPQVSWIEKIYSSLDTKVLKRFKKYVYEYVSENFGFEDVLDDIKWILVEMCERPSLLAHEKDYCMLYGIPGSIDSEDIESAKGRLGEIGYELVYLGTPGISARAFQVKQICWIVKSEFFRDPYLSSVNRDSLPTGNEERKTVAALQKNILLEMWKERPDIDNDKLAALLIFNHRQVKKVDELFREFLGPKAESIARSLVKEGDRHRIQNDGYDFEIAIVEIKMAGTGYVDIYCEVLKGGEVTIFSEEGQPTMSLEEATEEEYGWEIENEIRDCIEEYFYTGIGLRNKTGYSIDACDWTFE